MSASQRIRIGVDVGGTFTDFVLVDGRRGVIFTGKQLTTHQDPSQAICEGVERILGDVDNHPIPVPFALVNGLFIAETNLEFDDTRAARIHRKEEARTKKETIAMRFFAGSEWLVTEGPFSSFRAEVENVTSAGLVRVLVNIFGRMTPVELEPSQLDHPVRKRRAA